MCYNIVHRDFDHLSLPQNSTLAIYLDDIMLIGPGEQEVTTALDILVRHLHARSLKINLTKIQGFSTSVKCLGVLTKEFTS